MTRASTAQETSSTAPAPDRAGVRAQAQVGPLGLAEVLRELSDDELARLLGSRPDLMQPVAADFGQLASRAGSRGSLARILDQLDRLTLAVLEGIVQLEPPASEADLVTLLGAEPTAVRGALERLRSLALAWEATSAWQVPNGLREALGSRPGGLGPPLREALEHYPPQRRALLARDLRLGAYGTSDGVPDGTPVEPSAADLAALLEPAALTARLLEAAGPQARELAAHMDSRGPTGQLTGASRTVTMESAESPVEQLLARAILVAVNADTVVLPAEIGLHLRGGHLYSPDQLAMPEPDGTAHDRTLVDRTAGGAALEACRLVERLLQAWGEHPPAKLRGGGVGVRDLRRTAATLEVDEHVTALLMECAYAAGLLGVDNDTWLPTHAYDRWLARGPAQRWADLVTGWLTMRRAPGLVGRRDERDRLRAALSAEVTAHSAEEFRRLTLRAMRDPADPSAPRALSVDGALSRVRWTRPRRRGPAVDDHVRWAIAEAATLGLTGLGSLATPGEALLLGEDAATALEPLLPEPVDHVLLQADLTAVAPGPLASGLAHDLAQVADAESHGGATVYRFTPGSVRRALDQGRTAGDLHELLERASTTPVPQPLSYLVDDVARRHGHLRAGSAASYLRCDDAATLATLLADRRADGLGLRRLAPTVVISSQGTQEVLDGLRSLGYAPTPETADGALVLERPATRRAPDRTRASAPRSSGGDPDVYPAAVRVLRTGDRARASRPPDAAPNRLGRSGSVEAVRALQTALGAGETVWIGYVDGHGGSSDRIVDPVRIDGGWLTAFDHAVGAARTFALHRITGVATASAS